MPKTASATKKSPAQPLAATRGLAGWVEVFKSGSHIDSKGRQITFSAADLDQVVANHALGAAPAVIGHPHGAAPAYAWVEALKREGELLFAKFTDINPAFEAGVKAGAYRNRSVSVYPDKQHGWRLRHVGWLGAEPPAIDGLAPVEFSAAEDAAHEFSAPGYSLVWGLESVGQLLRSLRERIVEKEGIEAADQALPQWRIDNVVEAAGSARTQFQEEADEDRGPQFSKQPDNTGGSMSFTQEQLDAAKAQAAKEAEDKLKAEFAAKNAELVQIKVERQRERIANQITGWKAEGKVLPAEEAGLAEFMAQLEDAGAEFAFSASDGKEAKKTPAQFFADFMASRKALVKLGMRQAAADPAPGLDMSDANAIAKAARSFQAAEALEGREISIDVAVAHVTEQSA